MKRQPGLDEVYDCNFYARGEDDLYDSPRAVVPIVCRLLRPARVVDVGCGTGVWLSVFKEHGVGHILGIDGPHVRPEWLRIPREFFRPADLSRSVELNERFDLAVCLEVAEHLPAGSADGLVGLLTRAAPCVLFSAAVPLQGGAEHVNEQWPEYWHTKFEKRGYRKFDIVRREIWTDPKVKYWYRQNIFLYASADCVQANDALASAGNTADDLILIHRGILEAHLRLQPLLRRLPGAFVEFTANQWRKLRPRGK